MVLELPAVDEGFSTGLTPKGSVEHPESWRSAPIERRSAGKKRRIFMGDSTVDETRFPSHGKARTWRNPKDGSMADESPTNSGEPNHPSPEVQRHESNIP